MKATVIIEELKKDTSLLVQIQASLEKLSIDNDFSKAKAIFIKPNLTYPTFRRGVTTRIVFIEKLIEGINSFNASTRIYIGEGEGGYNSFSIDKAMLTMGYYELEKKFSNLKVVNLSTSQTRTVELKANGKPYQLDLPILLLDEVDFCITVPLPKVHCMTTISLSFKNQWGCLPDTMRLKNHFVFNEIIGQVCQHLKFRYALLDGKFGLDSNGPIVGIPVDLNWYVASNSLGAFDKVVSEMMGFEWLKIPHIRAAAKYGFVPSKKDILIIGDVDALRRKFILKRTLWDYPALAAFHSSRLTHLVYLSIWGDFLHRLMYMFRKKPIN